jgi:hypothetical protein
LSRQLQTASYIEKPAITLRWEETLKECHLLQFVVDLLERQQGKDDLLETTPHEQATGNSASPKSEVQ